MHELLSTFNAQFNAKNPRDFWDKYFLSVDPKSNSLRLNRFRIITPSNLSCDTYWKWRIGNTYNSEAILKQIGELLLKAREEMQACFESLTCFSDRLQVRISEKKITSVDLYCYGNLCSSFHRDVLQVYMKKSWSHFDAFVDGKLLRRDFVPFFPVDLVLKILSYVVAWDRGNVSLVCKNWRNLLRKESWKSYFPKIRCISHKLILGQGINGTQFNGSDLVSQAPGVISGLCEISPNQRVPTIWDAEGKITSGPSIQYAPLDQELYVHSIFLNDTKVILFRNRVGEAWVELWNGYQSEAGSLEWLLPIVSLTDLPIDAIKDVWLIEDGILLCFAHLLNQPEQTFILVRFDFNNLTFTRCDAGLFTEYRKVNGRIFLCKDTTGEVFLKRFKEGESELTTCDLGRHLDFDLLYDWTNCFIAFWSSLRKNGLRIFTSEQLLLDRATSIDVTLAISDKNTPACSGFTKLPLVAYTDFINNTYHLQLHWLDGRGMRSIPLDLVDPVMHIEFIHNTGINHQDRYLLLATKPLQEKLIHIEFWDYSFMKETKLRRFSIKHDSPTDTIQIYKIKSTLIAVLVSQQLNFFTINPETNLVSATPFYERVHEINFANQILTIFPFHGKPIIASL